MNPAFEQRQYPRRTSFIIAEYEVNEGTFRDIIKDICAGGVFIETDRELAVGQLVSIEFPLFNFDNIIRVSGSVARRDPGGYAVTFDKVIDGLVCKEGYFPEIVHEKDR